MPAFWERLVLQVKDAGNHGESMIGEAEEAEEAFNPAKGRHAA